MAMEVTPTSSDATCVSPGRTPAASLPAVFPLPKPPIVPREPAVGVGGDEGAGVGGVGGGVGGTGVGGGVGDSAAFVERMGQVVPIEF